MPWLSRVKSSLVQGKVRRLDDEAAAIAAKRIRNGAADHKEDGIEALARLGIRLP